MTFRQLLNRYSYVLLAGLALLIGAFYVSLDPQPARWIAWAGAAVIIAALYLLVRPDGATARDASEAEHSIGHGLPSLLELYSSY